MPSSSEFENFENTEKDRWGIIKNWLQDNQADIVLVIGIILIALISFGLGWLSAPKNAGNNSVIIEDVGTGAILDNTKQESNNEQNAANQNAANNETANPNSQQQGIIVASKNGTKYHWPWCSWAKKIKPENQVWFKSESEAQKAGYTACGSFQKLAPASYKP
jgi:hypothetical protein